MLVDSHCHLNLLEFSDKYSDLKSVLSDCWNNAIEHLLCVAIDLEHFNEIKTISETYPNISISVGVHPNETDVSLGTLYDKLMEQAQHPNVVAIGETGLDYYRSEDYIEHQQNKLITHIEVAKKLNKPLIIHSRMAPEDTIKILKENGADTVKGVMHCFTETYEVAKQALDLGFYISLSGIVTFKNAAQVHEVATKVPLDRLLVETDCPYLAPVPYRGKLNYPQYVQHVAEKIAELKSLRFEDVAKQTTKNFYKLFNISK